MPSLSRIFGWTPSKGEEHVEIPPRPGAPRPTTLRTSTSSHSSPALFDASSPTSSTSSLSEAGFPSHQYPEPIRRGDPNWVARPRNPFIIFRCEFSREHTKEGKRVRRAPGSHAEKTLSSRAAEAWRQLSEDEKTHFKELAEEEKEEHARLHPNYRFRPTKRSAGGKKRFARPSSSGSQQHESPTPEQLPGEVVALIPRYLASAPTPEPRASEEFSTVKTTRRRSASSPLPLRLFPPLSGSLVSQAPKIELLRSRSVQGNRESLPGQVTPYSEVGSLYNNQILETPNNQAGSWIPEGSYSPLLQGVEAPGVSCQDHLSILGMSPYASSLTSSSLTSWNGDLAVEETYSTSYPASSWSLPTCDGDGNKSLQQTVEYQSPVEAQLAMALTNYPLTNDPWTALPSQYPQTTMMTSATEHSDVLFLPMTCYDEAERAYALQEYGIGLNERVADVQTANEDALLPLDINEYFHAF